jgi:hypothetical protein
VHKIDHFFNFCVTAHSVRDFFFERKGIITTAAKAPYHQRWNADSALLAAAEIANSSKHLTLRLPDGSPRTIGTNRLRSASSTFVQIYKASTGLLAIPVTGPDILVTLSDGKRCELHQFTARVLKAWQAFLAGEGIKVSRLSLNQLLPKTSIAARVLMPPLPERKRRRPANKGPDRRGTRPPGSRRAVRSLKSKA